MKKILFLIMMLVSTALFGQKNNRVKIEYSYLNSVFFEHAKEGYVSHSYDFGANRIGVFYNRKLYKWFRAETGVDFVFSKYTTKFQGIPSFVEGDDSLYMVNFPIILSVEFLRYFYVRGVFLLIFS